jgi:medium-chain acyl-[acyl-carrier-protein] hydrolase
MMMKIEQKIIVGYDEVDADLRVKLPVLFQWFQRAALNHSEAVGLRSEQMLADGGVWILNRIRADIRRMPAFREEITLQTWHKGSVGFRAGRDFLLLRGNAPIAAATSQWLFYDLNRKRISKIPPSISGPYTTEAQEALAAEAIDFAVDRSFAPIKTVTITTREGDLDPNGHVNNTVYLEYLSTLLWRSGMPTGRLRQVGIQYLKEIGRDVTSLQAGLAATDDRVWFRFFDDQAVFAAGYVVQEGRAAGP